VKRWNHRLFLLTLGAASGCGGTSSPEPGSPAPSSVPDGQVVIHFTAEASPAAGTLTIKSAYGETAQGVMPVTVVQDGQAGSGPANSVELVTTMTGFNCGFPNSFCGQVVVRSFYTQNMGNVLAHITAITPATGHAPLNSDPPSNGLTNTFGLWSYGILQANGGNSSRLWAFGNDGQNFTVTGEVQANLSTAIGCSDGQREGFTNLTQFPNIAGCSGGWSVAGMTGAANCSNHSGDDFTANTTGAGCRAADLCAAGWHVCTTSANTSTNLAPNATTCANVTVAGDPSLFFATQQSGPGSASCGAGANDLFGCGNLGATPNANCNPLTRFSNNLCGSLGAPWSCGSDGFNELNNVTKSGTAGGGVLCCRT
jgi:hypothetical protein